MCLKFDKKNRMKPLARAFPELFAEYSYSYRECIIMENIYIVASRKVCLLFWKVIYEFGGRIRVLLQVLEWEFGRKRRADDR